MPETRRSLDTLNLERRHQRPADFGSRELLQVELRRLAKIRDSFVDIITLARRAHLGAKCNPQVILSMNDRSERPHSGSPLAFFGTHALIQI